MKKDLSGYGIKVETWTGFKVWLALRGTTTIRRDRAFRFHTKTAADEFRKKLSKRNPHAILTTKKISK